MNSVLGFTASGSTIHVFRNPTEIPLTSPCGKRVYSYEEISTQYNVSPEDLNNMLCQKRCVKCIRWVRNLANLHDDGGNLPIPESHLERCLPFAGMEAGELADVIDLQVWKRQRGRA